MLIKFLLLSILAMPTCSIIRCCPLSICEACDNGGTVAYCAYSSNNAYAYGPADFDASTNSCSGTGTLVGSCSG